jgi:hypothetical protein
MILCESCPTEEARAPSFNPKFLMKAIEGGASSYRLTTVIFKMSDFGIGYRISHLVQEFLLGSSGVISCPSKASMTLTLLPFAGSFDFKIRFSFESCIKIIDDRIVHLSDECFAIFSYFFPFDEGLLYLKFFRSLTKIKSAGSPYV